MARKRRPAKPEAPSHAPAEQETQEAPRTPDTIDPREFEIASAVSKQLTLDDVVLAAISARRADDLGGESLKLEMTTPKGSYGIDPEHNRLVIMPRLALAAHRQAKAEEHSEPAVIVEATFVLLYTSQSLEQIPPETLRAFARTQALLDVWPFWRELLMSISTRMRMPPLVVNVLRL
jgi:hypothetical protein